MHTLMNEEDPIQRSNRNDIQVGASFLHAKINNNTCISIHPIFHLLSYIQPEDASKFLFLEEFTNM